MSRVRPAAAVAIAILAAASLTGCTARFFVSSGNALAAPPASLSAPAEYYLDTICPRNGAVYAFDDVRASTDLAVLHRAATVAAVASQRAALGIRAADAPWPASLQPDLERLAVSLDQDADTFEGIADAPTVAAARSVPDPGATSAGDARFAIRAALGLTTDTDHVDDCVGHYAGSPSAAPGT